MNESTLTIDGAVVRLLRAGLRIMSRPSTRNKYLTFDLYAEVNRSDEYFFAINGFSVAGCKDVDDLQGHTYTLTSEREGNEPEGSIASGELAESVMGNSELNPMMFHSVTLKFGELKHEILPVEVSADAFDHHRAGILVVGFLFAEIDRGDKSSIDVLQKKRWWKMW